jgi:hypothetical protein
VRSDCVKRDRLLGKRSPGNGRFVNLFAGLLQDARDGSAYYIFYSGRKTASTRFIINASGFERKKTKAQDQT